MVLKPPHFVGRFISEIFSINFSFLFLYLISSSIVIMIKLNSLEISMRSSSPASSPSYIILSQIIPAGYMPEVFARSTAASVWPALISTPPG